MFPFSRPVHMLPFVHHYKTLQHAAARRLSSLHSRYCVCESERNEIETETISRLSEEVSFSTSVLCSFRSVFHRSSQRQDVFFTSSWLKARVERKKLEKNSDFSNRKVKIDCWRKVVKRKASSASFSRVKPTRDHLYSKGLSENHKVKLMYRLSDSISSDFIPIPSIAR